MQICGLQIIVLSKVPSSLRWGRNCVVVEPKEAAALVAAQYGDTKPLTDLLDGHAAYLDTLAGAAA